jgi:hypothetical protein
VSANEWTFIAFETVPIFLAFVTYAVFHFGRLLDCNEANPRWVKQIEEARKQRGNDGVQDEEKGKPLSSA